MKAFVLFVIFVHVSQHASGITVFEGVESVQLLCRAFQFPDVTKVVWSHIGSNPSTVHEHQNEDEPFLQNQHYSGRTSMSADALITGDFSLTLEEPSLSDCGDYFCNVYSNRNKKLVNVVELDVRVSQHSFRVEVFEGAESVLLPCNFFFFFGVTKVVWSRFGFNPSTVHKYNDFVVPRFQNQHYSGRTFMSNYTLITGDYSLTLKEPRLSDSGLYTCTVYNNRNEKRQITVPLQVTDRFIHIRGVCKVLLLALGPVLLLAVGIAKYLPFFIVKVSRVEVKEGVWFVKLPFQTFVKLPEDATVEWSRCSPKPMKVHEYRNGGHHLIRQDEFYCNRTKMDMEPLKTRDLSLTLKNPCFRDSGTYICTVHKDREIMTHKLVQLRVEVVQEVLEAGEWVKSVTLPFKTRAQLPGDATVEWRRSELTTMKVHVFKNGQDQPGEQNLSYNGRTEMDENLLQTGDLSLTLRNLTVRDFGIYSCTVLKDGDPICCKIVQLKVKGRGWLGF